MFAVNERVVSRGSLHPYLAALRARFRGAPSGLLVVEAASVEDTVAEADAARRVGYGVIPLSTID